MHWKKSDQDRVLNVGWLDPPHEFARGTVSDVFIAQLGRLVSKPQRATRGFHRCRFCQPTSDEILRCKIDGVLRGLGHAEIDVTAADGTVYAAPTLIYHYVTVHGYRPPDEFIEAVRWSATDRLE